MPPPPPLPMSAPTAATLRKPPSPMTSPIESSSDDAMAMELLQESSSAEQPSPVKSTSSRVMQVERPSATSSVSDISDAELPAVGTTTATSDDNVTAAEAGASGLSDLEAERAKLRAQLEKAQISEADSEGEIHSSDAEAAGSQVMKTDNTSDGSTNDKEKLGTSPISSENPSPMPPKEDDHQEEKSKDIFRKPRSDEDDEGGAGQGGSGGAGSKDKSNESSTAAQGGLEESKLKEGQSSTSPETADKGDTPGSKNRGSDGDKSGSSSSHRSGDKKHSSSSKHRHSSHGSSSHHHRHSSSSSSSHSSSSKSHHKDRRHSSSSSSSKSSSKHSHDKKHGSSSGSHHRRSESSSTPNSSSDSEKTKKDRRSSDSGNSAHKKPDNAPSSIEKKEKDKRRSEKLEEKVNKAFTLKSDKFKSFDMFAPKPKPKLHQALGPPTLASPSPLTPATPQGQKTPTTPTLSSSVPFPKQPSSLSSSTEHKSSSSMTNGKSSLTQSSRSGAGNSTPTKGDPAKISQVKKQLIREKIARQELLEPQRTKFPELKVSKGDGVDKLKQHEDDLMDAKRRLQQKREELLYQNKMKKELKKKSGTPSLASPTETEKRPESPKTKPPAPQRRKSVEKPKARRDSASHRKRKSSESSTHSDDDFTATTNSVPDKRPPRPKRSIKNRFCRGSSDEEEEDEDKIESLDNIEKAMAEVVGEGTEEKGEEEEEQRHPEVAKADPQNAEKQPSVPQQPPPATARADQHWQLQQAKPKTKEEMKAAEILKSDKPTKELYGFDESDIAAATNSSTMLAEYLDRTGASSIPISEVETDEICERIGFVGSNDYMWFDASGYPGGAQAANKLVTLLKKFGGSPKTVHPMPNWLAAKLERWRLQRHQVELIFDVSKVRKRKLFVTEAEYDARFPLSPEEEERLAKKYPSDVATSKTVSSSPPPPKQPKLAGKPSTSSGANAIIKSPGKVKVTPPARGKKVKKVVYEAPETLEEPNTTDTSTGGTQEEGDFRGWSDADADLLSATSKRIDRFTNAGLDLNGNTFGMLPSTIKAREAEEASTNAGGNSDGLQLQVKVSPSLINHFKTLLGPDSNVIHLLSDGDTDGSLSPPDIAQKPKARGKRAKGTTPKASVPSAIRRRSRSPIY